MGHICEFECELRVDIDGEIVIDYYAYYKRGTPNEKSALVYQVRENGECFGRYIELTMCGYTVTFPNEKLSYYFGGGIQQEYDMVAYKPCNFYAKWINKDGDLYQLEKEIPDLRYLIHKWSGEDPKELLRIISNYRKEPSIEALVKLGLNNIATDKRLPRLSKKKKKEIVLFLSNYKQEEIVNLSLTDILFLMNHPDVKNTDDSLGHYKRCCYQYDYANMVKAYKERKNYTYPDLQDYAAYKKRCKAVGHDFNDPYWSKPNDWVERNKVVWREYRNMELAREEKIKKEKQTLFNQVGTNLKQKLEEVDGYSIYIPTDLDDVQEQAKVLHQCLISCDYPSKVIRGDSILVFVKKNGKPKATYEVLYDKKIRQAYADEQAKVIHPSKEIENAFSKWLENAVFKKLEKVVA